MKLKANFSSLILLIFLFESFVWAQERRQVGRPPVRKHTITERGNLNLIPADDKLPYTQEAKFKKSKTTQTEGRRVMRRSSIVQPGAAFT